MSSTPVTASSSPVVVASSSAGAASSGGGAGFIFDSDPKITTSPTIEAEDYENNEMFAPLEVVSAGERTFIVSQLERNDEQADNTPGQAHYTITANDTTIELYATLNLRDELTDSFFYKIEGLSDWAMENARTTNGFEELLLGAWNNAEPGQTYTVKLLRRETGAQIDSLRVEGAMFGVTAPAENPFLIGKQLYEDQALACVDCHGINGDGVGAHHEGLVDCVFCSDHNALASIIETTMPKQDPSACDAECAAYIAYYVKKQFNPEVPTEPIAPTKTRAWLLTATEYRATLTELLGLPSNYGWMEGFTDVSDDEHYYTSSDHLFVSQPTALYFLEQSEAIASGLSEAQLSAMSPCNLGQEACITEFTRSFASRAFRKDLTNEEADRYLVMAEDVTGIDQYRQVIIGILNSPFFLYRTEIGNNENIAEGDTTQLTGYEVASLISYALTGKPPTDELMQAARDGELNSIASIRLVINEMLTQPDVTERLHSFIRAWLLVDEGKWAGVEHSDVACGNFDAAKDAIEGELDQFLRSNATINSSLEGLFTAALPEPTGALREYYLSNNDPAGVGPQRKGILSSGIFAARHAQYSSPSPVMRGVIMRKRLLCQELPEPPANVPMLGEVGSSPNVITNRDVFEAHLTNAACSGCHQLMDPLGFTLEHMDACGRYRTVDNGGDIDASGEIYLTDFDMPVDGIDELSAAFSNQPEVRECFVSHAYQFYRGMDSDQTPRALTELIAGNLEVNDSLRDVIVGLLTHESILTRAR
ncbi:MAG TPA: DUF1588 domain-containing protein [Marinagarivorans sp.]